jgi:hypothetical protein
VGEGRTYEILPGVGEVANRMIDCERHCAVGRGVVDEARAGSGTSLLQGGHRRQVGVDQLNRYGLRDLLQLLRVRHPFLVYLVRALGLA